MDKWISVNKKLPEVEGQYLVHAPSADKNKPFYSLAWWSTDNSRWEIMLTVWAEFVTHWQPLTPPGDKDE